MKRRFRKMVDRLKWLNFWVRHASDQADAKMLEVNALLQQLGQTGWVNETVILGPIVHRLCYAPRPGCADAGQVVQAALCVPGGLGVVLWDSEEYAELSRIPDGPESEAALHLQPFEECEPALKALLVSHIEPLLQKLFDHLG